VSGDWEFFQSDPAEPLARLRFGAPVWLSCPTCGERLTLDTAVQASPEGASEVVLNVSLSAASQDHLRSHANGEGDVG
jgi:hypothetical protein